MIGHHGHHTDQRLRGPGINFSDRHSTLEPTAYGGYWHCLGVINPFEQDLKQDAVGNLGNERSSSYLKPSRHGPMAFRLRKEGASPHFPGPCQSC